MDNGWDDDDSNEDEAVFEEGLIEEDIIEEDLIPIDEDPINMDSATIEYPDGSIFTGLMINGIKRTGKQTFADGPTVYIEGTFENEELINGKCVYKNGDEYEGDMKNGHPHGTGLFKYHEDAKVYIGSFSLGMREGNGTCAYVEGSTFNGQKYEGNWLHDDWHGVGRLTYEDGVIYEGSFNAGECHGSGTLTYTNGRKLISEWKEGVRCQNPSRIIYPNGDEFFGLVELGTGLKLEGTYTHINGDVYQGEWATIDEVETKHGNGKMTFVDGKVYEGKWVTGRRCGYGECIYDSGPFAGQTYKGEWLDDKWEDKGCLLLPTGERYNGMFHEGEMHGVGVLTGVDGVEQQGIWEEGEIMSSDLNGTVIQLEEEQQQQQDSNEDPAAQNLMMDTSMQSQDMLNLSMFSDKSTITQVDNSHKYSNGDVYVGETNVQGYRHGKGVLTEGNGNVYDGQFLNNYKHGSGSYTYKNGDVYEGDFVNNMRQGTGRMKFAKGGYASGTWINDRMHGKNCELQHHKGLTYVGGFENHRKHGDAVIKFPDGSKYSGSVKKNKLSGRGTYVYANGDVYEGEFEDGHKQGRGKMTYKADGSLYTGEFSKGKRNGVGTITYTDGRKVRSMWVKDVMDDNSEVVVAENRTTEIDSYQTSSFLCLPRSNAYGKIK